MIDLANFDEKSILHRYTFNVLVSQHSKARAIRLHVDAVGPRRCTKFLHARVWLMWLLQCYAEAPLIYHKGSIWMVRMEEVEVISDFRMCMHVETILCAQTCRCVWRVQQWGTMVDSGVVHGFLFFRICFFVNDILIPTCTISMKIAVGKTLYAVHELQCHALRLICVTDIHLNFCRNMLVCGPDDLFKKCRFLSSQSIMLGLAFHKKSF
ncbi:hypothetical protein GOP47_0012909 [Adiantum capillus-veneris]|uniref:Uncharacterized protein n=1 Tax=Adiantum capillus-veneris TaxID=13818 RepID=A0A9D4ZES1_ADICA|nr:hypothetical protein GOP47_0012909 [Adiantum capillus-veneris]